MKRLKRCKYFRDVTWTNIVYPDNSTQQIMHCRCPKNSVAYLVKRHTYETEGGVGYQFSFACSPQTVSIICLSCFLFLLWIILNKNQGFLNRQRDTYYLHNVHYLDMSICIQNFGNDSFKIFKNLHIQNKWIRNKFLLVFWTHKNKKSNA